MQTENRFLDDLARMASGALSSFTAIREEMEARLRQRLETMLERMDLVTREEFDAIKAVAQAARADCESLAERVARLEAARRPRKPGTSSTRGPKRGRRKT
jgi:BMFP domain-containing protein YqiC